MNSSRTEDELVDELDADGSTIGTTTRARMRDENLWHRSTMVVVVRTASGESAPADGSDRSRRLDPGDRLVVHRRADWKDVFGGYWDLCFGGVCDAGEDWLDAARRELAEEAGLSDIELSEVGRGVFTNDDTRCHAAIFLAVTDADIRPDDGEVVEVDTIELGQLDAWAAERTVCPDTRALVLPILNRLTSSVF